MRSIRANSVEAFALMQTPMTGALAQGLQIPGAQDDAHHAFVAPRKDACAG